MRKIRNFHEGHSTAGEWQGSGWVVAGERHGMCDRPLDHAATRTGCRKINIKYHEGIQSSGSRVTPREQTDKHDEADSRCSQFCERH
jgi:hypothetical protein